MNSTDLPPMSPADAAAVAEVAKLAELPPLLIEIQPLDLWILFSVLQMNIRHGLPSDPQLRQLVAAYARHFQEILVASAPALAPYAEVVETVQPPAKAGEPASAAAAVPSLRHIVFHWRREYRYLSDEQMKALIGEFVEHDLWGDEHLAAWSQKARPQQQGWVALTAHYLYSLREAQRLQLTPRPELAPEASYEPLVLVDAAYGEAAGKALAARWHFPYRRPETLFYYLDSRRDGDALIRFIGDDRGEGAEWRCYIAIEWAPADLEEEGRLGI